MNKMMITISEIMNCQYNSNYFHSTEAKQSNTKLNRLIEDQKKNIPNLFFPKKNKKKILLVRWLIL